MKTLKEFSNVVDAGVLRAELGAAGIEAFIQDEATATIGYGGSIMGVRLAVEDEDYKRALEVLGSRASTLDGDEEVVHGSSQAMAAFRIVAGPFMAFIVIAMGVVLLGLVFESLATDHGIPEPYAWFGAAVLGLLGVIVFQLSRIARRLE